MLRSILTTLVFVTSLHLSAQTLSFSGGVNRNDYFGINTEKNKASFNGKYGYAFQCTIDDANLLGGSVPMRASIVYQHYESNVMSSAITGQFSNEKVNGAVKLDVVGIEFYPFNIRRYDPFYISFGVGLNWLINQEISGTRESWKSTAPYYTISNLNASDEFIKPFTFGLLTRFGYRIPINERLSLEPSFKAYLGCSQELQQISVKNFSVRQSVMLGILWKLNK